MKAVPNFGGYEQSRTEAHHPYAALVIFIPLTLGITLFTAGMLSAVPIVGAALLTLGVVLLVASFIASRQLNALIYTPQEATIMALYVAVEFMSGCALLSIAGSSIVLDSILDLTTEGVIGLGIWLMLDSTLLYRRGLRAPLG